MFSKIGKRRVSDLIESANIIQSNASILKILDTFIKMNSYNVYYKKGNKITAINLRDILSARDIHSQNINSVANTTPTISEDNNIEEAANIMSHYRLRSVPVVEDKEIIGQISTNSIVKSIGKSNVNISSTKIMTGNIISINEFDPISRAKELMIRHRIDQIPIIDDSLKGIVTSFDIAKMILNSSNLDNISYGRKKSNRSLEFPIKDIAERTLITSRINDSIAKVIQLMDSTNSFFTIVTLGNKVQGIITYRDIMSLLGQRLKEDVPVYIIGLPENPVSSQLAKSKFKTFIKFLKQSLPDLAEVRCRIKLINVRGKTKRYEVDISVFTTTNRQNYINDGSDIAKIFDRLRDNLKKELKTKIPKVINKT